MKDKGKNSFGSRSTLTAAGKTYTYYDLPKAYKSMGHDLSRLPYSLKILLENLLRTENGLSVRKQDIEAIAQWNPKAEPDAEAEPEDAEPGAGPLTIVQPELELSIDAGVPA